MFTPLPRYCLASTPITLLLVAFVVVACLGLFALEYGCHLFYHLFSLIVGFQFNQHTVNVWGNNNLMIRHRQEARVLVLRPASVAEEKFLSARSMMSTLTACG